MTLSFLIDQKAKVNTVPVQLKFKFFFPTLVAKGPRIPNVDNNVNLILVF